MKIGLALSGGGVLGVAHLGVLRSLEAKKIDLHAIAGTSAGAIAGALFAAGGTKLVDNFLADLRSAGLFDKKVLRPMPDTVFAAVRKTLEKYLPEKFYDLRIKFSCIATDFATGEVIILDDGDLIPSVLASCAFPGVFPAQEIGGKSLIDGAMSMNLPATVVRKMGADFVIGSSLYNIVVLDEYNEEGVTPGRINAARRAIDIMQKRLAEYEITESDYCFTPPVEGFGWYNFDKLDEIRKTGEDYASAEFSKLLAKIKRKDRKGFWAHLFGE